MQAQLIPDRQPIVPNQNIRKQKKDARKRQPKTQENVILSNTKKRKYIGRISEYCERAKT